MTTRIPDDLVTSQRDAFTERLFQSSLAAFDIFTIYIGDRLGLYRALSEAGWCTSTELAARTQTNERYVREWLEQQTTSGILEVEDASVDPMARRFRVPPAYVEVLVDADSLNFMTPLARLIAGSVFPLSALLDAYRDGSGVPFLDYGPDLREGQAAMNRASFLQLLGTEWLPSIPDVHLRLQSDPPARVADIGCGAGWSSIGIARAYPNVQVDGFDLDEPSIVLAQANAAAAGLTDRVQFQVRDAGDPTLAGRYQLVTAFECVHDMSDPVSVLRSMRSLAGDEGVVLIMDERVGEAFTGQQNDIERFMYGFSVLHCLPVGMADQPSAATGTVMRPDTLRRYAREAGFRDIEILPIENFFFNFYRLVN